jgi:hypothetical protein
VTKIRHKKNLVHHTLLSLIVLETSVSFCEEFLPCNFFKGLVFGGENGPRSPYFEEKLSEFAIFKLHIPIDRETKGAILMFFHSPP